MSDVTGGKKAVTVEEFLNAGRDKLELDLVAGQSGLARRIDEAAVNRPGLALTGFYQYFAPRRVQVFGHAEMAYLHSLPEDERRLRVEQLFERHIPCLVVTRRLRLLPEIEEMGERHRTPVLRTPLITKNLVNAATIVMENLMAPRTTVQGTMVEILGIGVLLSGKAGVGKSETALALIKKGHSLVADDVTAMRLDSSGAVIGAPVGVTRYHMEIRGLGIIHVPGLFGVASMRDGMRLDLIIRMQKAAVGADDIDRTGLDAQFRDVLGVAVPLIAVPVAAGRDLTNVVEVAALNQRMKQMGHDAARELDEKLKVALARKD